MKKVIKTALVCAISLVVIFSCKKEDPKAPAKFAIDSSSKAFDELEIGKTSTHTFKVTNAGEESLELKSFNFSGTNPSEFESNGQTTIVKASESTEFTVTFKPASVGDKSATLAIGTNVGEQKVELTGKAKAKPANEFVIDAESKDFGSIGVNKTAEHTFTITNKGTADLEIKSVVLEGTDKDQFSTDGVAKTIVPNNTYAFKAIFKPTSAGSKTATIKITSNLGERTVKLTGSATANPVSSFTISPVTKDFGNVKLGKRSEETITIKNTGTTELTISSIDFTSVKNARFSEFFHEGRRGKKIASNGTYTFRIFFSPKFESNKEAKLEIVTNAGKRELLIMGFGEGIPKPKIVIEDTYKPAGNVNVGKTVTKNFTIKNEGRGDLIISSMKMEGKNKDQFIFHATIPKTISPKGSYTFTMTFRPTSIGSKSAYLNITNNDRLESVSMTGKGIKAPVASCINKVNIPDANFKRTLLCCNKKIDKNGDGIICIDEAKSYTGAIYVAKSNIRNLTGIEVFTKITTLDCGGNKLRNLDLSKHTALTYLNCSSNQLTSLNVANGKNEKLLMKANRNSSLKCIQIDKGFTPKDNFIKDSTAEFKTNCN